MFRKFSELSSGSPACLPLFARERWTTAFLCILLVLGGAGILHAAPQHPNLFVNASELDQLRMKLKTEPWRARLLEQVKKDADDGNPVAVAVVYAMTGDRVCGAKVRAHLLQQAKDFVPGRPGAGILGAPRPAVPSPSTWRRRSFRPASSRPWRASCGNWRWMPSSTTRASL